MRPKGGPPPITRGVAVQQYQVARALGLTVVPVEELRAKIVLVREHDIVLIRADLGSAERDRAMDWAIRQALELRGLGR